VQSSIASQDAKGVATAATSAANTPQSINATVHDHNCTVKIDSSAAQRKRQWQTEPAASCGEHASISPKQVPGLLPASGLLAVLHVVVNSVQSISKQQKPACTAAIEMAQATTQHKDNKPDAGSQYGMCPWAQPCDEHLAYLK
jgi:hypothetical protein